MRHFVLGFVALAFGFLFGVGYSVVAVPDPAAADTTGARLNQLMIQRLDSLAADQAQRDDALARELKQARLGVAALRDQVAGLADAGRSSIAAPASRTAGGRTTGHGVEAVSSTEVSRALAVFRAWETDTALRAKWSGATADDLRAAFGPPTQMKRERDGDALCYTLGERELCRFLLVSGRVAAVSVIQPE